MRSSATRKLRPVFVYLLIFIACSAVTIITLTAIKSPQEIDTLPDDAEPETTPDPLSGAICGVGIATVVAIAVVSRTLGPTIRFVSSAQARQIRAAAQIDTRSRTKKLQRLTFLFLLIILAAFIIIRAAIPVDRLIESFMPLAVMIVILGGAIAISLVSTGLIIWRIHPANLIRLGAPMHDISDTVPEAPPMVATIIQQLANLGFTRLGEVMGEPENTGTQEIRWMYVSEDKKSIASILVDELSQGVPMLLSSFFETPALIETHYPYPIIRTKRPDYVVQTVMTGVGDAFAAHQSQIDSFVNTHGAPIAIDTVPQFLEAVERIARPYLPIFARWSLNTWLGGALIGLIAATGLLTIVLMLHTPTPGLTISCLFPLAIVTMVYTILHLLNITKTIRFLYPKQ
jgi:hypothetical protein